MYIVWIILGFPMLIGLAWWLTHTYEGMIVGGIVGIILFFMVHRGSSASYDAIIKKTLK